MPAGCQAATSLRRYGGAEGVGAHDLWRALFVEHVKLGDREAGGCQEVDDRPGEVAAAEQPFLHRLETMLPATYPLVRGEAMFEEAKRAARLEDPTHFG